MRLLNDATFRSIPAEESCCFLNHLLRFYVENVFKHYTPTSDLIKRKTSSLANSFLSVKRDLRQCHAQRKCNCGEQSRAQIKKIQNAFEMLDQRAATVKAYSEVDILIRWMHGFQRN
ncbi:interleukin-20-like [Callorhinchus milii]|uniref:interleukin-20-like n=1 Tax=Callorhinchus milii TaxID=7868 RepID=UPI0004574933|nr:interleukin-20-like [Callorhinchus milii]|eukprot:gi/632963320/ref/XP_007897814.1/ PREDICTED: interleukin-20-like [Callorhinchus milii]